MGFVSKNGVWNTSLNESGNLNVYENVNPNLLKESGNEITSSSYLVQQYSPSSYLTSGKIYTVSICVTPASEVTEISTYLSGGYRSLGGMSVIGGKKQVVTITKAANYYSGKSPTDNAVYGNIQIYRFPNPSSVTNPGKTTIHWIKVEEGSIATAWCPNVNDYDGLGLNTGITTTAENFYEI